MPRFHLSMSDMLRLILFWERQYKSIDEMLNSGIFVWDTQTTRVVKGPESGGLDFIQCVCNVANKYPGARFLRKPNGTSIALMFASRKLYVDELKFGYIVDHHLEDGDIILFNKQPSLRQMSIMRHRVITIVQMEMLLLQQDQTRMPTARLRKVVIDQRAKS
ncbi:unnamed protein product [Ilex paraguariensis]